MSANVFFVCAVAVQSLWSYDLSRSYERALTESMPARMATCVEVGQRAADAGKDWELMISLAFEESRFVPDARSSAGAVGPMQVLPRYFCPDGVERGCDLIAAGLDAWQRWYDRTPVGDNRVSQALCHYNSGTTCSRAGRSYAARILGRKERFGYRAKHLAGQVSLDRCLNGYNGMIDTPQWAALAGGWCVWPDGFVNE